MVRFTEREWTLLRLVVLSRRIPLDEPDLTTYRGLVARVGVVLDDEWQALLAKLKAAAEEEGETP
jgi:hypothetical protein